MEIVEELFHQRKSFALIAAVVMHLAAAGLGLAELDGVAEPFEDADDGLPCFWKQSVVVAGDEERNTQTSMYRISANGSYDFRIY